MGYISTQEVKAIREEIKKVLTAKDGFKLSISRRHYSVVVVKLIKSPLEINYTRDQVNHYYLDRIECKNTRTIFELIDKAITRVTGGVVDRNANDPGADYANCNFFIDYGIELS
jgi:hypothetical protein